MKTAIIGTAGRDKTKNMCKQLWDFMVADAKARIPKDSHVVSGGAAWADHIAVQLLLDGHATELTLHLPAPFNGEFMGPAYGSSASAANYYHVLFSRAIGVDTLKQIETIASWDNVHGDVEPAMHGYSGMINRNSKVAKADFMFAYTFGKGTQPADGGTLDTWNKCKGIKTHVTLPDF